MKRFFLIATVVVLAACNNEKAADSNAASKAIVPADMHGFTPQYSASFVMDSAKNTETVLALWQEWKSGDLSGSRGHFADSVSFFFPDGTSMAGPSDTIVKNMQAYRNSFAKMEVNVDAVFALKSTDKDENWVAIWGSEIMTDKNGKVDTVSQQETWRFNKAGKVDMMMQAARKGVLPPPPVN